MSRHLKWTKVLVAALAVAAAAAGGYVAVRTTATAGADERVGLAAPAADPRNADDEKMIRDNAAAYAKAFKAGDAKAVAAFWAPDGEFDDVDGRTFRGREAIEKELAAFFKEVGPVTIEITPDSLRFLGGEVALENGTATVKRVADGEATSSHYSIVHVKRDGKWLLASVKESEAPPTSNYEALRDLEWLIGKWSAKSGGVSVEVSCDWTGKRNYIARTYTIRRGDESTQTGTQIIAWDPVLGTIRSWTFDSDDGFASELWTRDGDRWAIEATGVLRDGREVDATHVMTRVNDDAFTWKSVKRSVGGADLPDGPEVKVTRMKDGK